MAIIHTTETPAYSITEGDGGTFHVEQKSRLSSRDFDDIADVLCSGGCDRDGAHAVSWSGKQSDF